MKIEVKISANLKKAGRRGITYKELLAKCRVKGKEVTAFNANLQKRLRKGLILEKSGRLYWVGKSTLIPAILKKLHRTYGFAEIIETGEEVFVAGNKLKGALTNDKVMLKLFKTQNGNRKEGEVVSITEENTSELCGVVRFSRRGAFFTPDGIEGIDITLQGNLKGVNDGDKIIVKIIYRGRSHRDMKVKFIKKLGSANEALTCCDALLYANSIEMEFSKESYDEAQKLAKNGISEKELINREDLRNEIIFTIDGADSKDLDDAISLQKYKDFYILGVHIADVSYYVKEQTPLDSEALKRGTSIYYANKVIPMLPKALSNGICSLNPNEERLAFSAIITLSLDGKILDYDFKKSVITSRVKGVYSEVNEILSKTADENILQKYKEVLPMIPLMKELADILYKNRKQRGAPDIDTVESKISIDKDGRVCDVSVRSRGESEKIIEEFMLTANEAAATLAKKLQIPFVYRIHEKPDAEKLGTLKEILKVLGISSGKIKENPAPKVLSEILDSAKSENVYPIISRQVLRSMAKAKYSENPIGHYGLALEDYAHFTSPIRRYPDLAIHRILSDLVTHKRSVSEIQTRYKNFCHKASASSTEAEIIAMNIERECDDYCKAEYMHSKIGETFEGMITSVTSFGFFVMLDNSIEGLVKIESLPDGEYFYDGLMEIKNLYGSKNYRVGDKVSVTCVGVSVNEGNVDFVLC